MEFTFVKGYLTRIPSVEYNWLLKVTDIETLLAYTDSKHSSIISDAFYDLIHDRAVDSWRPNNVHFTNHVSYLIDIRQRKNGTSPIVESDNLGHEMYAGYVNILTKYGGIYFQNTGSYMPISGVTETQSITVDESEVITNYVNGMKTFKWHIDKVLTEKDIKITRFPNGKHYYVKVAENELGKRSTPSTAQRLADDYIKRVNKR